MFGLCNLPWWGYFVVMLVFTQLTIFATTIYLHRHQAHRSVELHPIVSHFFRLWLWLSTGTVTKEWTAIHRKHHARVETDDDPHSPQISGIKTVMLEGAELYRKESKNQETLDKFGEGTPNDWIERHIYSPHSGLGIMVMLAVDLILFGPIGLTMWAVQMGWIPFFAAGVINGIGHYFGYRNFECKDASRNIVPWGIWLGGEELHNNHHAFATSAKFSSKWWEVDSGWYVIKLLQFFGLAKPRRVQPKIKLMPGKTSIDDETLKALISNRMQVMSRYTREVIVPALKIEKKRAGKAGQRLLLRAKTILTRDASILKSSQKDRLVTVLENYQSLRIVYQYRIKLQEIWGKTTASQKELLEALQEWCKQAEATGIDALLGFVNRIKMLVPQETI